MKSPEDYNKRNLTIRYTSGAVTGSIILLIAAFFISTVSSESYYSSFADNFKAFTGNPLFLIISAFTFLVPLFVFYITKKMVELITNLKEHVIKSEENTSSVHKFITSLLEDDFSTVPDISGENILLSESLTGLRDKLKINREKEVRKNEEDKVRNWLAESESHFSEILRNNMNNPESMSFMLLKDLTRQIDAVQGGFYLLDDSEENNRVFNLLSFFAYDRKKFADRQIKWGDGLIGTCALEKKTILMNNIPDKYIRVTSGLGDARPRHILLEPIMHDDRVYGVMEFASLGVFESRHINLINKVAAGTGATLAAVKTNLHTARLLEDSKEQANILASQEEEMRQNMEELKATQEEAARQSRHLMSLENSINNVLLRADFDTEGRIIWANRTFLDKLQYSSFREVENKHLADFLCCREKDMPEIQWDEITACKSTFEGRITLVSKHGLELWYLSALTPVKETDGTVQKVLLLAMDMTECQQQLLSLLPVNQSAERTGIKLETDIHGTIIYANPNFLKITGISKTEFNSLLINDIIDPIDAEVFARKWEAALKGNEVDGIIKIISRSGDEKWLEGSLTGIFDINRQICRVMFSGRDITSARIVENDYRQLSDSIQKYEKLLHDTEKESIRKVREIKAELTDKYRDAVKVSQKYERMLDECNYGVIITSNDSRISFFNKTAEEIWQIKRTEVLDRNIASLFPGGNSQNEELLRFYNDQYLKLPKAGYGKISITGPNGEHKNISVMLSLIETGRENEIIAFIRAV